MVPGTVVSVWGPGLCELDPDVGNCCSRYERECDGGIYCLGWVWQPNQRISELFNHFDFLIFNIAYRKIVKHKWLVETEG